MDIHPLESETLKNGTIARGVCVGIIVLGDSSYSYTPLLVCCCGLSQPEY